VHFYEAATGALVGTTDAHRIAGSSRVESLHIWPPADKALIQIGRFGIPYELGLRCGRAPILIARDGQQRPLGPVGRARCKLRLHLRRLRDFHRVRSKEHYAHWPSRVCAMRPGIIHAILADARIRLLR
jgi:hypothetical protein